VIFNDERMGSVSKFPEIRYQSAVSRMGKIRSIKHQSGHFFSYDIEYTVTSQNYVVASRDSGVYMQILRKIQNNDIFSIDFPRFLHFFWNLGLQVVSSNHAEETRKK
jgi:hypothetical protein